MTNSENSQKLTINLLATHSFTADLQKPAAQSLKIIENVLSLAKITPNETYHENKN